ncbi:MAG TPA: YceI family protein [Anaeromyxobacteraceae bacterium]|nr:YceI family protein [Anaeromyxobacteraceae bacterium]
MAAGPRRATGALVIAAAALAPMVARPAGPSWAADPARSRIAVHVLKKGLLSGMAHDHHFEATAFRATAVADEPGGRLVSLEVVVRAASLRDRQPDLSPEDRAKVDAQAAGEDVLDAGRFPELRFVAGAPGTGGLALPAAGEAEGTLPGSLTLRGQERSLAVPVRATREGGAWRAKGSVRFKQSDFGIEPYSGFLGTIAVHDEVEVEWDLLLVERQPGG